jgi:hypothetical protein
MTIAISVKVGEGLVYVADSTSSFFDSSGGKPQLVQSFHHARKLIRLGEYPIGILTFGLGHGGGRNLESLVAEFENALVPAKDASAYTVEAIAGQLRDFVALKYDAALPPPTVIAGQPASQDSRPGMGIVIGGYSSGEFFPDEFLLTFPGATLDRTRPNSSGDFGVMWWGVTEPIIRLVLGFDPGVQQWFVDKGVDAALAKSLTDELKDRFKWSTVFDGMPLQDAIDYGAFLANVTIGHSRFVVGPPVCGGPVDVATISHRGFAWVKEKRPLMKGDSVFF